MREALLCIENGQEEQAVLMLADAIRETAGDVGVAGIPIAWEEAQVLAALLLGVANPNQETPPTVEAQDEGGLLRLRKSLDFFCDTRGMGYQDAPWWPEACALWKALDGGFGKKPA